MNIKAFLNILKINLVLIIIFFFSFYSKVFSHELWLEPQSFYYDFNENIETHIKIGQNLDGATFGFLNKYKKKLYIENKNKIINLNLRDGDYPAIQLKIQNYNFNILNYETNFESLTYKSFQELRDFIFESGMHEILDIDDFQDLRSESYKRYAKAILVKENNSTNDFFIQISNLDFEIIPLSNPYEKKNVHFKFKLLSKGKPMPNWKVKILSADNVNFFNEFIKTDKNVEGEFKVVNNRKYLLNSVFIKKNNLIERINLKTDFSSYWASLTFGSKK